MNRLLRGILFTSALATTAAFATDDQLPPASVIERADTGLSTDAGAPTMPQAEGEGTTVPPSPPPQPPPMGPRPEPPSAAPTADGPIDAALAARIASARTRLDALISARQSGDQRIADASAIAEAEAAELALAQTRREAGELAWRLQQMRRYQAEIQADGIRLPDATVLYEVDLARGFQERDRLPITSIEPSMQLAYATQDKTTFSSLDANSPIPGDSLKAGQTFLKIGVLRSPEARRVLAWVLGRGQLILADSDIEIIEGE